MDIGLKFKSVILHIHPDDILSTIAGILLAKLDVKLFMYNHADHMFSFGYGAAERIFEISKYGWMLGEMREIKHKQSYVGIPAPEINIINNSHKNNKKVHIFMAGNSNKFKPWGSYSVPDFINQVYENDFLRDKVKFSLCGPTGREYYWKELKAENLDNVEFLGLQHHKKFIELLSESDCYIDSFPQGNGTAFVESIMLNIPSFGLNLLAGSSYADLLRSNSTSEIINSLVDYINNKDLIKNNLINVRKNIITEQSIENCSNRLTLSMKKETFLIPDYLASMNYVPFFHERLWKDSGRIIIDYDLLSKLSLSNKLKLIKCWSNISYCNYNSLLTYLATRIKCIFQNLLNHITT
ncbi:hypothetical protein AYM39_08765 [Methylomonas sp. DH-1]|nr:hypothetical protein AYM39_08765 [Methylomonas sp. DH-1]